MQRKQREFPVVACLVILLTASLVSSSHGEEEKFTFGFSGLFAVGEAIHDEPDHTLYGFLPRVGMALHRNWDAELEGNFSHYSVSREKDFYYLGANLNLLFKPIQRRWGSFFLLIGGGLGYDNSDGDIKQLGDSSFGGILQGGFGISYDLGKEIALRGEYRFMHISEPFRRDRGLNEHGFLLGISF